MENWTRADQIRYEQRIDKRLDGISAELKSIASRMTLMLGALGLVAFLLPILAPFLRALVGVDVPPAQAP